jgi:hypothetical protein
MSWQKNQRRSDLQVLSAQQSSLGGKALHQPGNTHKQKVGQQVGQRDNISKFLNENNGEWRTERDSNPRYAFTYTRVPGVRLQPLGHLSFTLRGRREALDLDRFRPTRRSGGIYTDAVAIINPS